MLHQWNWAFTACNIRNCLRPLVIHWTLVYTLRSLFIAECDLSEKPSYLKTDASCKGSPNQTCTFECTESTMTRKGDSKVACKDGKWKPFPVCGCKWSEIPTESTGIKLVSPNCFAPVGDKCAATCAAGFYRLTDTPLNLWCDRKGNFEFDRSLKCGKDCEYPPPLGDVVAVCGRGPPASCRDARCPNPVTYNFHGPREVECLKNGKWSELPSCSEKGKCATSLGGHLVFAEPCDGTVGFNCWVECKDDYQLTGHPETGHNTVEIVCDENKLTWLYLPRCVRVCPRPNFDPHLILASCELIEDRTCAVMCAQPFSMSTYNAELGRYVKLQDRLVYRMLTCLPTGSWSGDIFVCVSFCPDLELPANMAGSCSGLPPGESCNVDCLDRRPDGQVTVQSTHQMTCQFDLQWTPLPSCRHRCTTTYLPTHAIVHEECYFETAAPCPIACQNPAYDFDAPRFFHCTREGAVVSGGYNLFCYKKCDNYVPEYPFRFGECSVSSESFKRCHAVCDDGSRPIGNAYFTCRRGTWSIGYMKCERSCYTISIPKMVNWELNRCPSIPYTMCRLYCEGGRRFIDGSEFQFIMCDTEGKWNQSLPCEGVICNNPAQEVSFSEGAFIDTDTCTGMPGAPCTVRCPPTSGEAGATVPYITCDKDYVWHPRHVECRIACQRPVLPPHTHLDPNRPCGYFAHQFCGVFCERGFRLEGNSSTFTCQPSYHYGTGVWTDVPHCVPDLTHGCFHPMHDLRLTQAYIDEDHCKNRQFGARCRIPCYVQHPQLGDPYVECMHGKVWHPTFVDCLRPCPLPPLVAPARVDERRPCGYYVGQICFAACPPGYRVEPESGHFECQEHHDGQRMWTAVPHCVPLGGVCRHPYEQPVHVVDAFLDEGSCAIRTEGSRCRFVCHHRDANLHDPWITCGHDFWWNPREINCQRPCHPPVLPPDTFLDPHKPCGFYVGQTCTIICNPGFKPAYSPEFVCHEHGQWSHISNCVQAERECPDPRVQGVHLFGATVDEGCDRRPGAHCRVPCHHRNEHLRDPFITCTDQLQWQPNMVDCGKVCPFPPVHEPAMLDPRFPCGFYVGQTCGVTCMHGLVLDRHEPQFRCEEDAMGHIYWTNVPQCVQAG